MRWFSKLGWRKAQVVYWRALALLLFVLSACSGAEPAPANPPVSEVDTAPPGPSSETTSSKASEKSFLWQVSSSTAKVYLLGSIHVAKEDIYPLAPAIEAAYENSDALVLEVHMTKKVEAEVALKSAKLGVYPEGDSVEQHVSPQTWTRYSKFLEERGKPIAVFARMKPWLASIALMIETLGESGFSPNQGIDRHFQERAEKDGKPIKSLESVDDQLNTLATIDDPTQELMLLEFLDGEEDVETQMEQAFEAWQHGDAAAMESAMLESMMTPEYRPVFDKLFVERNRNMKAKLSEYLAGGTVHFVVVGSGHLVGKEGIVELLRQDHHQVEQL